MTARRQENSRRLFRACFRARPLAPATQWMLAADGSALNRCRVCLGSAQGFLQLQGKQFAGVAEALRDGALDAAKLEAPERLLLEFVGTISKHAYRVTDEQVQGLREVGWTDEQIAEAAYVAALFSLFVRLADTVGIEPPPAYEPAGIPKTVTRGEPDVRGAGG